MTMKIVPISTDHSLVQSMLNIKFANRMNSLLSVQSQCIQNKGEIEGLKKQQQDALDNQAENEKEYKKEKRHRILHAIVSIFAHVVNLVMTVLRPVKHLMKTARKAITKALHKSIGKSMGGLLKHAGLAKPMKHITAGVKKGAGAAIEKPGLGKRALNHLANGGAKSFLKRTALINGISGGLNGIGDGVFKIQDAKIKNAIANIENNIELISANFKVSEEIKSKAQDNIKTQVNENIQIMENVASTISKFGNLQMQLLTKAA